jgi:hypothetical protein
VAYPFPRLRCGCPILDAVFRGGGRQGWESTDLNPPVLPILRAQLRAIERPRGFGFLRNGRLPIPILRTR